MRRETKTRIAIAVVFIGLFLYGYEVKSGTPLAKTKYGFDVVMSRLMGIGIGMFTDGNPWPAFWFATIWVAFWVTYYVHCPTKGC